MDSGDKSNGNPKKRRKQRLIFAALGAVAMAIAIGILLIDEKTIRATLVWYVERNINAETIYLPTCDRIEVCQLDGSFDENRTNGFPIVKENYSHIVETRMFTGEAAEEIATLWRSQRFGVDYQALCHNAAYGFRFYHGTKLLAEQSVCFKCSSIALSIGLLGRGFTGFDTSTPQAAAMLKRLQEIFPASIPKPVPERDSPESSPATPSADTPSP